MGFFHALLSRPSSLRPHVSRRQDRLLEQALRAGLHGPRTHTRARRRGTAEHHPRAEDPGAARAEPVGKLRLRGHLALAVRDPARDPELAQIFPIRTDSSAAEVTSASAVPSATAPEAEFTTRL